MSKIIYKYRDWENYIHRKSITNNEVYFASPKSLNDPKELVNVFDYLSLDEESKLKFVSGIIKEKEFCLSEPKVLIEAKKWLDDDMQNNYSLLKKLGRIEAKSIRKIVGVFSTCNTSDNNHMWLNYANSYRGFCIGYDFEELRAYMNNRGFGGEMMYYKVLPNITPDIDNYIDDLFKLCLIKLEKWKPEDEYRYLRFNFVNRIWSIKSSIIKEIIIGEEMDVLSRSNLLKHVLRKYNNCKILIAKRPINVQQTKSLLINY